MMFHDCAIEAYSSTIVATWPKNEPPMTPGMQGSMTAIAMNAYQSLSFLLRFICITTRRAL